MIIKVAVPHRFQFRVISAMPMVPFWQQKTNDVHYIGGSEVLPAPLSAQEEQRALEQLGTDRDSQAKALLIEHNLRLVVYIAKKFDNTGVGVEDLISIGTIGLIKAINTFAPEKNIKLATYASRCIENEILMYLRRNSKTRMEVSIDAALDCGTAMSFSCPISWERTGRDIPGYGKRGGEEAAENGYKQAVQKRGRRSSAFDLGLIPETARRKTQKEVADLLGISQSYISRLEKKIMRRLRKEIIRFEHG